MQPEKEITSEEIPKISKGVKKTKKHFEKLTDKINKVAQEIDYNFMDSSQKTKTLKKLANVTDQIIKHSIKKEKKPKVEGEEGKKKSEKGFNVLKPVHPNTLEFIRFVFAKRNENYPHEMVSWTTLSKEVNNYIKENGLQKNPDNKHEIYPDEILAKGINYTDKTKKLSFSTKQLPDQITLSTHLSKFCLA